MKQSTGIAIGIGAVAASFYLNSKLNPPKLTVGNIDRENQTAEIVFDGTPASVSVDTVVEIPGRNGKTLKASGNADRSVLSFDIWKEGEFVATLRQINFI